jgi:hypothetical protein
VSEIIAAASASIQPQTSLNMYSGRLDLPATSSDRDREIADALQARIETEIKEIWTRKAPAAPRPTSHWGCCDARKRGWLGLFLWSGHENRTHSTSLEVIRASTEQLGYACWFDLGGLRGTVIGSGAGSTKGPVRLVFDLSVR